MEVFWECIPDFKKSEFDCKCGCGLNNISEKFIRKLQNARTYSDVKYMINSGCRCKQHNTNVNGSPKSAHLKGLAADIRIENKLQRYRVIDGLTLAGFKRIGIADNFIHVDIDGSKKQEIVWLY